MKLLIVENRVFIKLAAIGMGDEFCGGRAESNSFSLVGQSNFPIR
jgi:hypothetical protein